MGGAMAAQSSDYEAVYYNPANLLSRKAAHFGVGLSATSPHLAFQRLSGEVQAAPHMPEANLGLKLGAASAIGGVFEDRLAFGLTLYHPMLRLTRIESIDPIEPTFYRYDSLTDKFILALALAGEPLPWLRLGVGVQVLAGLGGTISAALSLVEGSFSAQAIDLDVDGATGLTAGLALGPFWGLRLGVTWRSQLELAYAFPIDVFIEELGLLDVHIEGSSLYTPDQLAIGLSWESAGITRAGVSVEVGLTWERWSAAPSHLAAFRLSLDNAATEASAEEPNPDSLLTVSAEAIPLGAVDTLTLRLGAEWRVSPAWALRAGYVYRPSPLPRPVYETNSLDSDAHIVSLGGGFALYAVEEGERAPLRVDLGLQLTQLHTREIVKAPQASLDGSYSFGGQIFSASLDLSHDF